MFVKVKKFRRPVHRRIALCVRHACAWAFKRLDALICSVIGIFLAIKFNSGLQKLILVSHRFIPDISARRSVRTTELGKMETSPPKPYYCSVHAAMDSYLFNIIECILFINSSNSNGLAMKSAAP